MKKSKPPAAKRATINGAAGSQNRGARAGSEGKGIFLIGLSALMLLALCSFEWSFPHRNWLGYLGHILAIAMTFLFGYSSFSIAIACGWLGFQKLCGKAVEEAPFKLFYFSLFILSFSTLLSLIAEISAGIPYEIAKKVYCETISIDFPYPHRATRCNLGGAPFYFLYRDAPGINLQLLLTDFGVAITFGFTSVVSLLLLTGTPFTSFLKGLQFIFFASRDWLAKQGGKLQNLSFGKEEASEQKPLLDARFTTLAPPPYRSTYSGTSSLPPPPAAPKIKEPPKPLPNPLPIKSPDSQLPDTKSGEVKPEIKKSAAATSFAPTADYASYQIPPSSLLREPKKVDHPTLKKELLARAAILEETLASFGIEAKVGEIHCGPTITSFEVHPSSGVKVQKIKALENDIALNMQAKSIRIIAPIPGKAAVGVEIPSIFPQEVSFREMLEHYQHEGRKLHIPVLLGKSVSGDIVMSDLAKMPHCIIAGATGSGKSVCINTIILSILMNARPDEIKLLMIDPKKVELSAYTNLPHLIAPVITEPHGAYAALNWLVREMQQRYEMLKQLGLRNINAFNERKIDKELEASLDIPVPETMFWIVAIIDEFADLMMASSNDLETPIARIAQMARAVGIHLILATQRPSREVITGLIKANFPTRISFKVSSRINSQIIIDDVGAESLLGNGDMLFLPPGSSQLMRAQGAYVSDDEINKIIQFITRQARNKYLISSFDKMTGDDAAGLTNMGGYDAAAPKDSLFDEAVQTVTSTGIASTTFLQRKLKIGYARAASLMDELEERGIVGPADGAKPRQIFRGAAATASEEPGDEPL